VSANKARVDFPIALKYQEQEGKKKEKRKEGGQEGGCTIAAGKGRMMTCRRVRFSKKGEPSHTMGGDDEGKGMPLKTVILEGPQTEVVALEREGRSDLRKEQKEV